MTALQNILEVSVNKNFSYKHTDVIYPVAQDLIFFFFSPSIF